MKRVFAILVSFLECCHRLLTDIFVKFCPYYYKYTLTIIDLPVNVYWIKENAFTELSIVIIKEAI